MAVQLDVAVDVRVNPDLHPQNAASLELYDDDTKGDLAQVVTAFDTAYQAAAKRGGSAYLNRSWAFSKWFSASVMPPPLWAPAG